jgi:hypothetical protein
MEATPGRNMIIERRDARSRACGHSSLTIR